ncbi:MAG: type VI secretion system accessory protein TagJ [Pseudomonadota bacterium]
MRAEKSLQDGNLQEALKQLQDEVRANPADAKLRVFLFQLLSVLGDWGRALNQLDVSGNLDAGTLAMVQTYREALRCEALRADVFAGKRSPLVFGDPEPGVALVLEALKLSVEGNHAEAQKLRAQAYETVPTADGMVDGQPFEWIADADSRIGPFLEAVINGNYYWVPFHRIHRIQFENPQDLRDMVWTPAQFTWANGGQMVGLIPTRYPGSENSDDAQILLAHKTEWQDMGNEAYFGLGQRILATDSTDYPLIDIRDITLDTVESATAETWDAATQDSREG